jgi:hypothetical protein
MLLMLTATPCALADGTVNVTLEDASEGGNLSGMKMTATPDSVKAGRVTLPPRSERGMLPARDGFGERSG